MLGQLWRDSTPCVQEPWAEQAAQAGRHGSWLALFTGLSSPAGTEESIFSWLSPGFRIAHPVSVMRRGWNRKLQGRMLAVESSEEMGSKRASCFMRTLVGRSMKKGQGPILSL